jgi:hypothetical protein
LGHSLPRNLASASSAREAVGGAFEFLSVQKPVKYELAVNRGAASLASSRRRGHRMRGLVYCIE